VSEQTLRKELKHDAAAPTLAHVFSNVAAYRSQIYKYGGGALAVVLVVGLTLYYRDYTSGVRQQALGDAIQMQNAVVGAPAQGGGLSFPTEAAKKEAVVKAYTKLATEQSGSGEGHIAEYALGSMDAENGKFAEARKKFEGVISGGGAEYASMARLSLAQIAFAEDKADEARKLLKELADNPTSMVSKNQANFVLARGIAVKNPAEARKILIALAETKSDISQIAVTALGELPQQ
jgi:predicted negative regulator of RcsB-dependent stress response